MPTAAQLTTYTPLVQQLYLAYFGRPADRDGLNFFVTQLAAANAPSTIVAANAGTGGVLNAAVQSIINTFGASAESTALFSGNGTFAQVNQIYVNVLNRTGDIGGVTYWTNEITSGRLTLARAALAIEAAASTDAVDGLIVAAKTTIATNYTAVFTDGTNDVNEIIAYNGNTAAASARGLLSQVTPTTTAAAFQASIVANVNGLVATANAAAALTLNLTTGADTLTGSNGNDTFNGIVDAAATSNTATAGDVINAGNGTDTLNLIVSTAANPGLITLNSVENVNIRALAATTVDNLLFTGTTNVTSNQSAAAVTLNNAALASTYTLSNTQSGAQADLTINHRANEVTGTADTAAIAISGSGSKVGTVVTTPVITVGAGIESVSVATSGTINWFNIGATTTTKTVTLTGAAGTNIVTVGTLNATSTIDASATTGTNTFNLLGAVSTGDTIKGGTGTDTVTATLSGGNTGVSLTGVENLTLNATSSGATIFSANPALTTLTNNSAVAVTIGGVSTLTNLAFGGTGSAGGQANILTLSTAFAGAADSVAVTVGNGGTAIGTGVAQDVTLTASGIETLAITTADTALTNTSAFKIADTGLVNLTITSVNNVTLTGLIGSATSGGTLLSLDTSASTGNLTFTEAVNNSLATGASIKLGGTSSSTNTVTTGAEGAADVISITGGAGANVITTGDTGIYSVTLGGATNVLNTNVFTANAIGANNGSATVVGSGGNDTITGSANVDTLSGGAGADTILGGAGADIITGGEGADTITGGTGADIITLTETTAAIDNVILAAATFGAVGVNTAADSVTGFAVANDVFQVSITGQAGSVVSNGNNGAVGAGASVVQHAAAAGAVAFAATTNVLILDVVYANAAAVRTAISAGGGNAVTQATSFTANSDFVLVWTDGTNSHISLVNDANAGSTAAVELVDVTLTEIVTLTGTTSVAAFANANFTFIA